MFSKHPIWISVSLVLMFATALLVGSDLTAAQSVQMQDSPVELAGRTTFEGALTDHELIFSPGDVNFCEAKATLVPVEKEKYELRVAETCGFGPRLAIWELTIDKDGKVGGVFQVRVLHPQLATGTVFGEIWLHTGCMLVGDFPALTGTWDGETLTAATTFAGRCHGGTMWGDPAIWDMMGIEDPNGLLDDGITWDDGPAVMTFGAALTVTE